MLAPSLCIFLQILAPSRHDYEHPRKCLIRSVFSTSPLEEEDFPPFADLSVSSRVAEFLIGNFCKRFGPDGSPQPQNTFQETLPI